MYIALALMIGAYVAFIIFFQAVPYYILWATIAFALAYAIWGVVHHLHKHSLHRRVVLEYLLVAILAVAIVATLLV